MSVNPLKNYKILLADSDRELAQVLKSMMGEMGFSNITTTSNGREALSMLYNTPFDFLITEWNTQEMNGISLLDHIRRDEYSPKPTLPTIMLTGRAEQTDVVTARDHGINEFMVKPFSAKAIYNRLERLIEHPRNFVVSLSFIGPDRRHKEGKPAGDSKERRQSRQKPTLPPKILAGEIKPSNSAKVWLPDLSLKLKLGANITLASLITPAVLTQAQAAIDSITNDSLEWIKNDLKELKLLNLTMQSGTLPPTLTVDLSEAALRINSRAGTFGYSRASEIAYTLYLFCRNRLDPKNERHHIVVQKHIEVLQVFLGNNMRGDAGAVGLQISLELKNLCGKYGD